MKLNAANLMVVCLLGACGDEDKPTDTSASDSGVPVSADTRGDAAVARDASLPLRDASGISTQDDTPAPRDAGGSTDPRFANAAPAPGCPGAPQLEPVYKHGSGINAFGIVGDQLYFAAGREGVLAMPKDGSAAPKAVSMENAFRVAVAGNTVYVRLNIGGFSFTPEQLAAGEEPESAELGSSVYAYEDHVYSWESTACYAEERPILSHDPKGEYDYHSMPCPVKGVAGRGGKIYATHVGISDNTLDGVYSMTFGEEDDAVRIVEEPKLKSLAVTATHLYFAKEIDDRTDYLLRAPIAGGSVELVAGPFLWRDAFSDGTNTYLSDSHTKCLYRVDAAANKLVPVAQLPFTASGVAYDAPYVYFGGQDGQLTRLKL